MVKGISFDCRPFRKYDAKPIDGHPNLKWKMKDGDVYEHKGDPNGKESYQCDLKEPLKEDGYTIAFWWMTGDHKDCMAWRTKEKKGDANFYKQDPIILLFERIKLRFRANNTAMIMNVKGNKTLYNGKVDFPSFETDFPHFMIIQINKGKIAVRLRDDFFVLDLLNPHVADKKVPKTALSINNPRFNLKITALYYFDAPLLGESVADHFDFVHQWGGVTMPYGAVTYHFEERTFAYVDPLPKKEDEQKLGFDPTWLFMDDVPPPGQHPRLFFGIKSIPKMKQLLQATRKGSFFLWEAMRTVDTLESHPLLVELKDKKFSKPHERNVATFTTLADLAFYCLVMEEPPESPKGKLVAQCITNTLEAIEPKYLDDDHHLRCGRSYSAYSYDFAWIYMTEEQRTICRRVIAKHAGANYYDLDCSMWSTDFSGVTAIEPFCGSNKFIWDGIALIYKRIVLHGEPRDQLYPSERDSDVLFKNKEIPAIDEQKEIEQMVYLIRSHLTMAVSPSFFAVEPVGKSQVWRVIPASIVLYRITGGKFNFLIHPKLIGHVLNYPLTCHPSGLLVVDHGTFSHRLAHRKLTQIVPFFPKNNDILNAMSAISPGEYLSNKERSMLEPWEASKLLPQGLGHSEANPENDDDTLVVRRIHIKRERGDRYALEDPLLVASHSFYPLTEYQTIAYKFMYKASPDDAQKRMWLMSLTAEDGSEILSVRQNISAKQEWIVFRQGEVPFMIQDFDISKVKQDDFSDFIFQLNLQDKTFTFFLDGATIASTPVQCLGNPQTKARIFINTVNVINVYRASPINGQIKGIKLWNSIPSKQEAIQGDAPRRWSDRQPLIPHVQPDVGWDYLYECDAWQEHLPPVDYSTDKYRLDPAKRSSFYGCSLTGQHWVYSDSSRLATLLQVPLTNNMGGHTFDHGLHFNLHGLGVTFCDASWWTGPSQVTDYNTVCIDGKGMPGKPNQATVCPSSVLGSSHCGAGIVIAGDSTVPWRYDPVSNYKQWFEYSMYEFEKHFRHMVMVRYPKYKRALVIIEDQMKQSDTPHEYDFRFHIPTNCVVKSHQGGAGDSLYEVLIEAGDYKPIQFGEQTDQLIYENFHTGTNLTDKKRMCHVNVLKTSLDPKDNKCETEITERYGANGNFDATNYDKPTPGYEELHSYRIFFKTKTVEAHFVVAYFIHYEGEPIPTLKWEGDKLKISMQGESDATIFWENSPYSKRRSLHLQVDGVDEILHVDD